MRVLEILGESISNGGEEAFIVNVLEHMDRTKLQIDVLTPYHGNNKNYIERLEKIGVNVSALGYDYVPGKSRLNIVVPIMKVLKKKSYDVVHIHSGSISVLMLVSLIAYLCKVKKIIVHSHQSGVISLKYRIIKCVSKPIIAVCPTDYCACSRLAGEWKFSKKIVENKLVVLKNGIDLDKFKFNSSMREQIRKNLGFENNEIIIGHVGRFAEEKNQEFLLEIFEGLKRRCKCKLLLIGSGKTESKIKQFIDEKNLLEDVVLVGNVDNVQDYMQGMDIFVFPSKIEGLGIVAIEAEASGLPVLASTEVPSDILITSYAKMLALSESIEVWQNTILEMIRMPRSVEREKIEAAGYNISDTAKQIRDIYME